MNEKKGRPSLLISIARSNVWSVLLLLPSYTTTSPVCVGTWMLYYLTSLYHYSTHYAIVCVCVCVKIVESQGGLQFWNVGLGLSCVGEWSISDEKRCCILYKGSSSRRSCRLIRGKFASTLSRKSLNMLSSCRICACCWCWYNPTSHFRKMKTCFVF